MAIRGVRCAGVLGAALGLLSMAWLGCQGEDAPAVRPNLMLVTVDTLRADRLACYGAYTGVGRELCALFNGGVRAEWAFSTAPSTGPSIASVMTSLYPRDHGVTQFGGTTLAGRFETLAEILAAAGYDTAAVVGNPVLRRERRLDQGFALYDDEMTHQERGRPSLLERVAAEVTDTALAWAEEASEPWFLWLHYQDPHGPYDPPRAVVVRDGAADPHLPVLGDESGWRGIPRYQALPLLNTPRAYTWRYDQEIAYFEEEFVRLVEGLDTLGSPPAILLTADHGEALGEDEFYFAHGHSVGIDQIHVPLLWRPPGGGEGAVDVVGVPVSTLDAAPTLLSAAGIDPPASWLGRPLSELARGEGAADPRTLFSEHRLRIAAIRGDHYYARDRQPLHAPAPDSITGGLLPPLPPRTAALTAGGEWPAYVSSTSTTEPLEAQVREFLAVARAEQAAESARIDPVTEEALRALGYLE